MFFGNLVGDYVYDCVGNYVGDYVVGKGKKFSEIRAGGNLVPLQDHTERRKAEEDNTWKDQWCEEFHLAVHLGLLGMI